MTRDTEAFEEVPKDTKKFSGEPEERVKRSIKCPDGGGNRRGRSGHWEGTGYNRSGRKAGKHFAYMTETAAGRKSFKRIEKNRENSIDPARTTGTRDGASGTGEKKKPRQQGECCRGNYSGSWGKTGWGLPLREKSGQATMCLHKVRLRAAPLVPGRGKKIWKNFQAPVIARNFY